MTEWRSDMENAPRGKDKAIILLLYVAPGEGVEKSGMLFGFWGPTLADEWGWMDLASRRLMTDHPTHWMPLPPPPEGEEA